MNAWLNSTAAHQDVKNELAAYAAQNGRPFVFTKENRELWLIELICDLFGVLLFGPAFFAAHRAYLQPLHPSPYTIKTAQPTHPPFAIRHKMLVQIMRVTGWDVPITSAADGAFHIAETEMLRFLLDDTYDQWSRFFDDADLRRAVAGVQKIFAPHGSLGYAPINPAGLVKLIERLTRGLPPILADIDQDGTPQLTDVRISQTLYAGWVYWIGRQHLAGAVTLDFLTTNRLCDHALLQQRAINYTLIAGVT